MKILFDTHTFLLWTGNPGNLPDSLIRKIENPDNELLLSTASSWEVEIKIGIGKLILHDDWENIVQREIENNGFQILPVHMNHTYALRNLHPLHKDPFDRMLIAQALSEKLVIATKDEFIRQYNLVETVWE